MKGETVFTNGIVVTRDETFSGTVQVAEGMIQGVARGSSRISSAIDLEGDYLLPGLIELHTDALERHFVPRPGVRWPEIAAAVSHDAAIATAGITTVFDAVALGDARENSERIRELDAMTRSVRSARRQSLLRVEHFLHLRCEVGYPDVIHLFTSLIDDPLVKMVSLMDHTPGQRQFTKIEKFYQYYQGKFQMNDSEMEELIRSRRKNQKKYGPPHRSLLCQMCRERGLPMASHDDTTVEQVREAAGEGVVLCEFPTTLEAAQRARTSGMNILMGAPNLVLGGSQSGNVSVSDLARFGLLDVLSSDYVPMSLLHGAFHLHHHLGWFLPQALRLVTAHPARIANLGDRGTIEAGKRADLIQVKNHEHVPIVKGVWRDGRRIC